MYIYQLDSWPNFIWDHKRIASVLGTTRNRQGRLIGRMGAFGFTLRSEAVLQTLTFDVLKSSEIEGEILDQKQVRSSIARRLGMNIGGLVPSDRHVDGVVEMILDATQNFNLPLTKDRLFNWHASLFPTGRTGMHKILVGAWRNDDHGPMRVVSGSAGHEKVHYEAPPADCINGEMNTFLDWINISVDLDLVLKAGIAHLWFVTLHPFEDGNGRIARAIADMLLARSDNSSERFYSMSVQIRKERNRYYEILERTQKTISISQTSNQSKDNKGQMGIDITAWLEWFLDCFDRALDTTEKTLEKVFEKADFWNSHQSTSINERQRLMINRLFDDFKGKLTSSKWAKITQCSQDTALRDILDLLEKKILIKDSAGGRSTSYSLKK